jgi:gliding motility-associated-like protein
VTTNGGTSPYTFNWSNAAATEDLSSLVAGVYSLTVTDNNLCSATISVTITEPAALTLSETHVYLLCNGANTGSINVTTNGGSVPYTFAWSNAATTEDLSSLVAGVYSLTVTDNNLCSATISVTITEPAALTLAETHVNVLCNGANTGSINVTTNGGTSPYTFNWSNAAATEDLSSLVAGVYSLTVTDNNLCSATISVTITEPTAITSSETHIDALCNGASNGSVDVSVNGGVGPYTYLWSNNATSQDLSNIQAGNYTVTITDVNLCTITQNATVNEPAAPTMLVAVTDATCFGGNGSATATPGGGTAPFSYTWSSNTINNPTNSLAAGTYTVSASDVNGCNQTASFTINQPADILIQETHTDVTCFGLANGDITLTVSSGVGPNYTYNWSPNVSTSNFAALLTAGTYNVTVTDQANCNKTIAVVISEPALPLTINVQSNNISCFGLSNGSINISTSGATTPYTYNWSPNVSTTNTATNLPANTYNITISDVNNCSLITNVTISEPSQPLTVTNTSTNLSCFQSNDGAITLNTTGGSFPYQFVWSPNVSTTSSATGLTTGNYSITITDNNGCTTTTSASLSQPTLLTATENHVNVLCNGAATGSIDVIANGGTPGAGYTYNWNPNVSTTLSATSLTAGGYVITVLDANNCSTTITSIITEPTAVQLNLSSTGALCFGDANGNVTATTTGGVSPFNYTLTSDGINFTPSSTGLFSNLTAGNYTIEVVDNNNCPATGTVSVTEPASINAQLNITNATCYSYKNGEIITTASGGAGGYVFSSSTGITNNTGLFSGLAAGSYSVTITDQNGCSVTQVAAITEPDTVIISILPNPLEVKLGESLQLNTTTNQGGLLSYQWTPSFGLSCADCSNPVFEGVYSQPYQVTITNEDGCFGTSAVVVTVVPNYDLFFPNAFTPNTDGTNDTWQMFGNKNSMKQIEVMVFNRIGEKVFESNDLNFSWDGKFKGVESPNAVYVYTAKIVWLNNHSDSDYKGTITLIK